MNDQLDCNARPYIYYTSELTFLTLCVPFEGSYIHKSVLTTRATLQKKITFMLRQNMALQPPKLFIFLGAASAVESYTAIK